MWVSVSISNVFNTSTFNKIFWKTKTYFRKLEYRFLVETTKIENTSFPFKTALPEANAKTNRMATAKWIYYKVWSFVSNYFIFLENLFHFRTYLKELIWCTNDLNVHICILRKRWSLILGCFFPVSILKQTRTSVFLKSFS